MHQYPDDQMSALHYGEDPQQHKGAVVPPIYMNSLHVFPTVEAYLQCDAEKDYVYGRVSNPTVHIVEEKLAAMEHGARGLLFASGMAALTTAVLASCNTGDHIICLHNCYGPTVEFLNEFCIPRFGMEVSFVGADLEEIRSAIRPNTRLMLLESPTSLVFEVLDLRKVAQMAKEHGILTYIDNTYCTPLYQKPLDLGIDISMHTLSKYLGGHSDLIGGALIARDAGLGKALYRAREVYGGIIGPQEGWLVLRGIRSLAVRLARHQETALRVAEFLEAHPAVARVCYPGLKSHPQYQLAQAQQQGSTGLLSFEIKGDAEAAKAVCNRLKIFQIGVSWGGFESLVTMPMYKRSPEQLACCGAERQLIRIHCGLEGAELLIDDLKNALEG